MCKGLRYIIKVVFFSILFWTASACTSLGPHYNITYKGQKFKTYSIYRPFVGFSEYRGGYWNDWTREDLLRYEVKNTNIGLEIVYFKRYNHPSDFEYKIIVKQFKNIDDDWWYVYDGEIHIKASNETQMRSKYNKDMAGVEALKDVWVFPATIKRKENSLPEEKYIFPALPTEMKYVYNVFYNGVGRAFGIKGLWVGADQYDPW